MSRITFVTLLFATAVAAACGNDERAAHDEPAAQAPPAVTAKTRRMVDARALPTRPENLVLDPGFASLGEDGAYALVVDEMEAHVEAPATSPAGPAQPVLVATPTAESATIALRAQGGKGPFDVTVFVAVDQGTPNVDVVVESEAATNAFEIGADTSEGATTLQEGRTYRRHRARIDEPVYGALHLAIVVRGKGTVAIAAPEIVGAGAGGLTMSAGAPRLAATTERVALKRPLGRGPLPLPLTPLTARPPNHVRRSAF